MAYKPSLKINISTNFDFGRLADRLPQIIKKAMSGTIENSAKESKSAIASGLSPPLKDSTKEIRKARGTGGSKPLLDTGKLYSSIKATKKGISFESYGQYHLKEQTPKKIPFILGSLRGKSKGKDFIAFAKNKRGIKVPARDFIRISEFLTKDLYSEIDKALRI